MAWYRLNKLESRPKARFTIADESSQFHRRVSASSQYGMGWWRTTQLGRPFVLHDGKTASYTAFNGMFLDNGFSIAIATNVALPNGESFEGTATKLIGAIPE